MKTVRIVLVVSAVALAFGVAAQAASGIKGSPHDFSGAAWMTEGEMCLPCHTPHNADEEIGYLWNHEVPAATDFTVDSTNTVLGHSSLACLSCHDGVTAIDSYSGNVGSIVMGDINPDAVIGRDLTDDHAVGVLYGTSTRRRQATLSGSTWVVKNGTITLRLNGSTKTTARVECTTCHTPHTNDNGDFLRASNAGSAICVTCHISQYDGSTSTP